MPRDQYDEARRELEQRVLEDSKQAPAARRRAVAVGGVDGGGPRERDSDRGAPALRRARQPRRVRAATRAARRSAQWTAPSTRSPRRRSKAMASKLAAKLENDPDNVEGWVMLARTYYALSRYADAGAGLRTGGGARSGRRRTSRRLRRLARRRRRADCAARRSSSSSARSRPIRRTGRRWRSPARPRSTARTTSRRSRTGRG